MAGFQFARGNCSGALTGCEAMRPSTSFRVEEFYSDYKNYRVYRWSGRKRALRNGREALAITVDAVKINTGLSESDLKK